MTTEETNLIPIKRDIGVLLSLDTYQGMTDEEIDSIIEFKCNLARQEGANAAETKAREEAYTQLAKDTKDTNQKMQETLNQILGTIPQFVIVNPYETGGNNG